MQFPSGFLWGVATAAYQIEGAVREDGRGESIWDRFSHTPGQTHNGETGDVACDHYHRYEQDFDLLSEMGVQAYRFSIAWPRIFPDGDGPLNQKGLDFYNRLVDALLEREITPVATLYHWDLPQVLQDRGGWANRETADHFTRYAETIFRTLGDRVPFWITHNEPFCSGILGHHLGMHAPGLKDMATAFRAIHHILLSHGQAVRVYRELGLQGQIGITLNLMPVYPASDDPVDRGAQRALDGVMNRWFLDAVLKGAYPEDMITMLGALGVPLNFAQQGDAATIAAPLDFLGVNYYTRNVVRFDPESPTGFTILPPTLPTTEMDWEVVPHCFTELLCRLKAEYGETPIYITENGAAYRDEVTADGRVMDVERIDYLRSHAAAVHRAIQEGVDIRGYFAWTATDNFEWSFGYSKRFGLIYVDYETQRRILKDSAYFYRNLIQQNGLPGD